MYRAMVVEDSKPILRNIVSQIEHVSDRIQVAATALNGSEALNKLRGSPVDVIFSDIRMPVMDGLDFLAEAKNLNPALRCIVISGYDDFEFARRAIQLRVDEYILKPIVEQELRAVLDRVIASLDRERRQLFRSELAIALKRGKKTFLPPVEFARGCFGICLIRSGPVRDGSRAPDPLEIAVHFHEQGCRENVMIFVETRHYSEIAVVADESSVAEEKWEDACTHVYESLLKSGGIARVAFSSRYVNAAELPGCISSLSDSLEGKVYLDDPTLLLVRNIEAEPASRLARNETLRLREEARLIAGAQSAEDFRRSVERLTQSWRAEQRPLCVVREHLVSIVGALNELANDMSARGIHSVTVEEMIDRSSSYEDLLRHLCLEYRRIVARERSGGLPTAKLADAAVTFFRSNLYRNVSMSDLAARLGVSPSYVHRVLRAALGKAPMEYYKNLKIDEAKQLIERYPHLKVKDIAESLGFQDQHYFSRVFRAHVALSPVEYRKRTTGTLRTGPPS